MEKEKLPSKALIGVEALSNFLTEHKDLASQYLDIYQKNNEYRAQIRTLEIQNQTKIAEITQRYQLCRDVLFLVFKERQTALNAHYATLDQAMRSGDRELIIASLKGISSIVEKNPLESFSQFTKTLDNPNEILSLDF